MVKGCGFLILCIIGFLGVAMLYYSITPYTSENATDNSITYIDGYIVEVFTEEDPTDSAYLKVIPVIEFTHQGSYYTDSAYHLARTTDKSGYVEDIGNFYYATGDVVLLEMKDPENYQLAPELPVDYVIQNLVKEWQLGLLIVGGIFMLIFLRGLSRTFRYKEPPRAERF